MSKDNGRAKPRPPFTGGGNWQAVEESSALGGTIQILHDGVHGRELATVVATINADGPLSPMQRADALAIKNAARLFDLAHVLARAVSTLTEPNPDDAAKSEALNVLERATVVLCDVQFGEIETDEAAYARTALTVEERVAR